MLRRRFKQNQSLEERLSEEAKRLREEAKLLPLGALRNETIRRAEQAETAAHISEWLRSPACKRPDEAAIMTKLDGRTLAKINLALEQACRGFPHGGDHEQRKYIAHKMMLSALNGNITFDELTEVADAAVEELSRADQRLGRR